MAVVIGAVVLDVGECLVNETREYGTWADWLGVPRHVFSAVFGAVIARGQDYRETFQVFRPGFDLDKARQQRADGERAALIYQHEARGAGKRIADAIDFHVQAERDYDDDDGGAAGAQVPTG